jgi:hypothetical protein
MNKNNEQNQKEIATFFSNGLFHKVFDNLAQNIEWNTIGDEKLIGLAEVKKKCERVSEFFNSVETDFKIINVLEDNNKIAINGTAEFLKDGKRLSFISAFDLYEFGVNNKIERITSYCISHE